MRLQLLVSLVGLAVAPAAGQRSDTVVSSNQAVSRATVSATAGSFLGAVAPSLWATASSVGKTATASFGIGAPHIKTLEVNFWARANVPLDSIGATSPAVLADLNGLRNSATVSVGVNLLRWHWTEDTGAQHRLCREAFANPSMAPDTVTKFLRTRLGGVAPRILEETRRQVIDSITKYSALCAKHELRQPQQEAWNSTVDYGHIWLGSISGQYGRSSYKFADTATASFGKSAESIGSSTAALALYLPRQRLLLAGSVRVEHAFKQDSPVQYCIPFGSAGGTECQAAPIGKPVSQNSSLATVGVRWFANTRIGLDPRLTCDLTGSQGCGVELPLLLRQPTDDGFATELTAGIRSKALSANVDDRFYVAITVGFVFGVGLATP